MSGELANEQQRIDGRYVAGILLLVLGGFGLLGSLVFVAAGGVFASVFPDVFGTPWQDLELDREGAECPGQITEVRPNPRLQVNNRPCVTLTYRYDPGDGERQGEVDVVDTDPLARLQIGRAVTVEYLPAEPSVSRIRGARAAIAGWAGAMGLGFVAVGLIAVLVCVVMVLAGVIMVVRARRRRSHSH